MFRCHVKVWGKVKVWGMVKVWRMDKISRHRCPYENRIISLQIHIQTPKIILVHLILRNHFGALQLFLFPILKYFSIDTSKGIAFTLIPMFFFTFRYCCLNSWRAIQRESRNQFTKLRQNVSYKFCYRKVGRATPQLGSNRDINNLIVYQKTF